MLQLTMKVYTRHGYELYVIFQTNTAMWTRSWWLLELEQPGHVRLKYSLLN